MPGTDLSYKLFSILHKRKQNTVNLPHGVRGHWIGDPKAKKVLVYYHGIYAWHQATYNDHH